MTLGPCRNRLPGEQEQEQKQEEEEQQEQELASLLQNSGTASCNPIERGQREAIYFCTGMESVTALLMGF